MTHDEREAERQAILRELEAVDEKIDAIQRLYGQHPMIEDARAETEEIRVRALALKGPTVH